MLSPLPPPEMPAMHGYLLRDLMGSTMSPENCEMNVFAARRHVNRREKR